MKLFYREIGEGEKPIVILHGLFGSSDNWLTQAKMLAPKYRVLLVDLRNHGQSPHRDDFNYDVMVEDLEEFFRDHNLNDPVLIGHSMGGKAAIEYALRHPDSIHSLVVVDIGTKAYPVQHEHLLKGLRAIPIDQIQSRKEADEALTAYEPNAGVRQFLLKNLQRKPENDGFTWKFNLDALEAHIAEIGRGIDSGHVFDKPTLFIRGRRSNYVKDGDLDGIRVFFPNAQLETLETGHWVQAEDPEGFVRVLTAFLEK